jgi:hypothetical protein
MPTFTRTDKYDPIKGYSRVRWGDRSKVLDIELSEMQRILAGQTSVVGKTLLTDGFITKGVLAYSSGNLAVPIDTIVSKGRVIEVLDPLNLSVGVSSTVYLAIWEQEIVSTDTVKRSGNQSGGLTVSDNGILDPEFGSETTHRYQLQLQLVTSNADATKVYLPVASIDAGGVVTDNRLRSSLPNSMLPTSAALQGTPTAVTAAVDTNNQQLATTAFVMAQMAKAQSYAP